MPDDEEVVTDAPQEDVELENTNQPEAVENTEEVNKPESEEPKAEIDEDPPVRRSVREHILARKLKKAVKETHEEVAEETGEELTPAGRKAIQQEVEPLMDLVRKQADDAELNGVFAKYPEARGLEKKIRKYMDVYENTPAEFIYKALIADVNRTSTEKAKADAEAKGNRTGGGSRRPKEESSGIKNAWEMSDAEFDASVNKLMSSR